MNRHTPTTTLLPKRLEAHCSGISESTGLMVCLPPCELSQARGQLLTSLHGRRVVWLPDRSSWNFLVRPTRVPSEPLCLLASYPWWRRNPADFDPQALGYREIILGRYRHHELSELAAMPSTESRDPALALAGRLSGGWPGLTAAAIDAMSAPQGQQSQDDEALGESIRAQFAATWLPLFNAEFPAFATLAHLPWLDRKLLRAAFPSLSAEWSTFAELGWLDSLDYAGPAFELDPALKRLLLETTTADHGQLELARHWYATHGHMGEAVTCAQRLKLPVDQIIANVLTASHVAGGAKARLGDGQRSHQNPDALNTEIGRLLSGVFDAIRLYRDPFSGDAVGRALSALQSNPSPPRRQKMEPAGTNGGQESASKKAPGDFIRAIQFSQQARTALLTLEQDPLNHRETQILARICGGLRNRDISAQLGLELSTVKWYATRIYSKLGVKNRTQAILRARELGLME